MYPRKHGITQMLGLTLSEIKQREDYEVFFHTTCGRVFQMFHKQDCCESVSLDDVEGDYEDLIGTPLMVAEEVSDQEQAMLRLLNLAPPEDSGAESETWTFYRLATQRGWVIFRWHGTSNGYYSERVDVEEVTLAGE